MKTIILLLIINQSDGSSVELSWERNLAPAECQALAESVWSRGTEIAYWDDQGPVPVLDAACVTEAQLSE